MYTEETITKRIKDTLQIKNKTQKEMLKELNLSKGYMVALKTSFPKANNLATIADYLDVSTDYLLGRTDNPKSHKC